MCYKKPGPRCSSHAKARLLKAEQAVKDAYESDDDISWEDLHAMKEEVRAAEMDFDATPAGMKYLELRIAQDHGGKRHVDEYKERLRNGKELRKLQLEAIKETDKGDPDTHKHQAINFGHRDFLAHGEPRKDLDREELEKYTRAAQTVADQLTPDQTQSVTWYTSDGFTTINHHLHNPDGDIKSNYADRERTERAVKDLDSMFATIKTRQPSVVYRGLNDGHFPSTQPYGKKEDIMKAVQDKYPVGSVVDDNTFKSTSYDPAKAVNFERYGVVMEVKAKSVLPIGHFSAWNHYECEGMVDRKAKLKVVEITEEDYHTKGRGGDINKNRMIVVKCEEIFD